MHEFGLRLPDGGPFEIGGDFYETNPRFGLPAWTQAMVQSWQLYLGGGLGLGYLPDAGGALDQPAIMMEAFRYMCRIRQELTDVDKDSGN